jgi:hypothetical protein
VRDDDHVSAVALVMDSDADTGAAVEDLADDVSVNGDGPDIDGTDVEETEED